MKARIMSFLLQGMFSGEEGSTCCKTDGNLSVLYEVNVIIIPVFFNSNFSLDSWLLNFEQMFLP
jgi:hypothetical protein